MKVKFTIRQTDRTMICYPAPAFALGSEHSVMKIWADGDYTLYDVWGKFDSKHFEPIPEDFKPGQRVTYKPKWGDHEYGMVKEVREDTCFVVYKCGSDWVNYHNYTGVSTRKEDLLIGWIDIEQIPDDGEELRPGEDRYHH